MMKLGVFMFVLYIRPPPLTKTSLRRAPSSMLRTCKLIVNTFHKFKVNFHIHYMPHYLVSRLAPCS